MKFIEWVPGYKISAKQIPYNFVSVYRSPRWDVALMAHKSVASFVFLFMEVYKIASLKLLLYKLGFLDTPEGEAFAYSQFTPLFLKTFRKRNERISFLVKMMSNG